MKLISWNVNGLRACMQKGFADFVADSGADLIALQETKMQPGQAELDFPGYETVLFSAEKKGYSGVALLMKQKPLALSTGIGVPLFDGEGRLIAAEYDDFTLVNVYTPNAKEGLTRIEERLQWEAALRDYIKERDAVKPVILCGDLNVAHEEIDLKNPAANRGNAGFSDEERAAFDALLSCGFVDSFRAKHPGEVGRYSWWSYRFNSRARNAGWRIDYFAVSHKLMARVREAEILDQVTGSDHCPIVLELD